MKQLGLATLNYESAKKEFPPSKYQLTTIPPGGGRATPVSHTTIPYLLSYMEESQIADKWDFKQSWDYSNTALPYDNDRLGKTYIASVRCATVPEPRADWPGATDYRVCDQMIDIDSGGTPHALHELIVSGQVRPRPNSKGKYVSALWNADPDPSSTGPSGPPAKIKSCTDGLSQTFMWFETGADPIKYANGLPDYTYPCTPGTPASEKGCTSAGRSWAQYTDWYAVHDRCGTSFFNCNNSDEIYSFHVGGAFFGMGDGAVKWISTDIDPDVFVSFFTRDSADILNNTL
jgi:hypothetical protein